MVGMASASDRVHRELRYITNRAWKQWVHVAR